jgi:hypothetical protein
MKSIKQQIKNQQQQSAAVKDTQQESGYTAGKTSSIKGIIAAYETGKVQKTPQPTESDVSNINTGISVNQVKKRLLIQNNNTEQQGDQAVPVSVREQSKPVAEKPVEKELANRKFNFAEVKANIADIFNNKQRTTLKPEQIKRIKKLDANILEQIKNKLAPGQNTVNSSEQDLVAFEQALAFVNTIDFASLCNEQTAEKLIVDIDKALESMQNPYAYIMADAILPARSYLASAFLLNPDAFPNFFQYCLEDMLKIIDNIKDAEGNIDASKLTQAIEDNYIHLDRLIKAVEDENASYKDINASYKDILVAALNGYRLFKVSFVNKTKEFHKVMCESKRAKNENEPTKIYYYPYYNSDPALPPVLEKGQVSIGKAHPRIVFTSLDSARKYLACLLDNNFEYSKSDDGAHIYIISLTQADIIDSQSSESDERQMKVGININIDKTANGDIKYGFKDYYYPFFVSKETVDSLFGRYETMQIIDRPSRDILHHITYAQIPRIDLPADSCLYPSTELAEQAIAAAFSSQNEAASMTYAVIFKLHINDAYALRTKDYILLEQAIPQLLIKDNTEKLFRCEEYQNNNNNLKSAAPEPQKSKSLLSKLFSSKKTDTAGQISGKTTYIQTRNTVETKPEAPMNSKNEVDFGFTHLRK